MKQSELQEAITRLRIQTNQAAWLPQIDLKAQATYQSEVISIDIPIPGVTIDGPAKDQYRVYLDVKQTLWDGGLVREKNSLEKALLETDCQKREIDNRPWIVQVDEIYFGLLRARLNERILIARTEVLNQQLSRMENAKKEGAVRQKDVDMLKAEHLLLHQKRIENESLGTSLCRVLSVITGRSIPDTLVPELPDIVSIRANQLLRPEYRYFELQQKQIDQQSRLLSAARNPVVYAFGQAGYGRPGLNMLSATFDPYYLVGVGLTWRVFDWNTTLRGRKIHALQQEAIGTLRSGFQQQQEVQLAEALEKVSRIEKLLETDRKMLDLRRSIAQTAASELENGTLTATDYLIDLNAETMSEIGYESRKIELLQAQYSVNTLLGND